LAEWQIDLTAKQRNELRQKAITSSRLITKGQESFQTYGRVDIRASSSQKDKGMLAAL